MVIITEGSLPGAEAAAGFAAIGSVHRVNVLRALLEAGPPGLSAGRLQAQSGLPASTLAHHLKCLEEGGLIRRQRDGRSVVSVACFDRIEALAGFLLHECCVDAEGDAASCGPLARAYRRLHAGLGEIGQAADGTMTGTEK